MSTNIDKMNYDDIVKYLLDIPKFVKKTDKDTIGEMLKRFHNPEENMKVIHVAGTNGKGSTCAFMNNILLAHEKKVGMFTSPHLVKINERIKINGVDVDDEKFMEAFVCLKAKMDEMMEEGYSHLSFFEMLFVLALLIFEKENVEYAIMETGLGGRLDATNIVKKPEVCVITTVSMDHMEILGETIEEIAAEKAGIIKENVPVVFYGENEKVAKVIKEKAEKLNAKDIQIKNNSVKIIEKSQKAIDFYLVNMYDKYGVLRVPFVMDYQTQNCALAITALEQIEELELFAETVKEGLLRTVWAGRMQEVMHNVYLDGAHNEEGLREFVKYVGSIEEDVMLLFSVVKEKDYMSMVGLINTLTNVKKVVVAPVMGARALPMTEIIPLLDNVEVVDKPNVSEAFRYAIDNKGNGVKLFCVGSLYMVGEIMEYIKKGINYND